MVPKVIAPTDIHGDKNIKKQNTFDKKGEQNMESRELALLAAKLLTNKKALDVAVINIGVKSSFADYFVLASGTTERQIAALRDEIDDQFAKEGVIVKSIEGKQTSGWILMDYGDVIINILTAEMRERYNIEKVWGDCEMLQYEGGHHA